jgi:hypothetical protein
MTEADKQWGLARLRDPHDGRLLYVIAGTAPDLDDLAKTFERAAQGDWDAIDGLKPLIFRLAVKAGRSKATAKAEARAMYDHMADAACR